MPALSEIAALLTAIVGLYIAYSTRSRNKTDAILTISQAAENIVTMRENDVKRLEAKIEIIYDYVDYLVTGIRKQNKKLEEMKIEPEFDPMDFDTFAKRRKAKE